ncbi:hypothetical protein SAMN04489732_1426 [Amycolatopsis saalfeldensis]|uniref:Uncharacterized protein n=1 Tax=Amycolatopsis saalfeldensis TaxID=394193 RepID=A0A1H8YQG2_9PSEU|nr:hypothetical protein SAMN04489732_1426 [Amycolatopsis saalfeldensis]
MTKGKRRKADGLAKEARRRARTAATAPARTDSAAAPTTLEDRVAIATQVDAWQFLLNYLNYVRDGGFDVPLDKFGPQRPGETVEEAELRLTVARETKEVQALIGDWAELCAEVAARPTLTLNPGTMVAHVADVGRGWLKTAGHVPDRDTWIAGARPLLGALCAPQHWLDALNVLDQVGTMGIAPGENVTFAAAQAKPAAALHAAAALVSWLFGQRSIVFDQTSAMRALARKTHALAELLESA